MKNIKTYEKILIWKAQDKLSIAEHQEETVFINLAISGHFHL